MADNLPKNLFRADSVAVSLGASTAAAVLAKLIGLARGVVLAWLISRAQFGLFGVALLVVNVLLPVCSLGLYEGVARYVPLHESAGTLRRFALRSFITVVLISLGATVILILFAGPVGSLLFSTVRSASIGDPTGTGSGPGAFGALMRASLICVPVLALYHTFLGLLKGLRMFRAVGVVELATAGLFTLLAVVGAAAGFTSARALMSIYAVACIIPPLALLPGLRRYMFNAERPTSGEVRSPESNLLTYSAWAAGTAVLWHALSYYPMWYLLKVSDPQVTGTFHAVRIVTQLVQVGAVMLTAIVAANVNRLWEHGGREAAYAPLTLLTKACLIALITGATIVSLGRPVVMRALPASFSAGRAAYDPLVLFFLLVGVVGLVAIRLNLVEKPRWVCLAWCAGAFVNVVMSYVLLQAVEGRESAHDDVLRAAAWAGVAGAASSLAVMVFLVRREGLGLDTRNMFLILAGLALGFGWIGALPILALLLPAVFASNVIFSPQERAGLRL